VPSLASHKPPGWLAIGIFLLWGAAMATLAGITLTLPGTILDRVWVLNPRGHEGLLALGRWAGMLFFPLGIALALAGFGWLKRRRWGWILAVAIIGINASADAVRLFSGALLEGLVGVVLAGALLIYLLSPSMRAYFE